MISCRIFGHDRDVDLPATCRRCGDQRYPQHDWEVLTAFVREEGIPMQYARRDIRCTCCGQERRVFWGLDLATIPDFCKQARVEAARKLRDRL